ncbi:MAG: Ig-like domain-containing protein [Clostridia bacterium]|nr:Ig-like domain-containing protein [Clostridia bacterium]
MQKFLVLLFGAVVFFSLLIIIKVESPIIEKLSVEEIALKEEYIVLGVGQSEVLLANVYPFNANNQKILWSTTDASVASVNKGIVKANKAGNVKIFAISEEGNFSDYCYVDVTA